MESLNGAITQRRRVLVVESDTASREAIARYLREAGYSVAQAANGLEVLERVSYFTPDVVLLDIQLPVMSGQRFVQALRSDPSLSLTPIVLLSAAEDLPAACAALGARGALAKPVDMDVLLAVLDRVSKG